MNKRLDFIGKVALLKLPKSGKFLLILYFHYVMSDFKFDKKRAKVFHTLYLENKKSFIDIGKDLFINTSPLYRYRSKFNLPAEAFVTEKLKRPVANYFKNRR